MKKLIIIILMFMLAGCSVQENTNYYVNSVEDMNEQLNVVIDEWKAYTGNEEITYHFNSWLVVVHPDIHEYYKHKK